MAKSVGVIRGTASAPRTAGLYGGWESGFTETIIQPRLDGEKSTFDGRLKQVSSSKPPFQIGLYADAFIPSRT
jgi:hypothetical protein